MLSLYRTLSLRYLQQRWSRALLIVLSIALGVATLVATRALNESMRQAVRAAARPLPDNADFYVGNGDSGVRGYLAADLARVPGVRTAEPLVFGRGRLPDLGESRQVFVVGMKANSVNDNLRGVRIDWTIAPERLGLLQGNQLPAILSRFGIRFRPVLVGSELDNELKAVPGDGALDRLLQRMGKDWADAIKTTKVRIQGVGQEPMVFIKAGTIRTEGPEQDLVKNLLVMETPDAADLLHLPPGLVTRIDLFLEPGHDRDEVLGRVKKVVGNRAMVRTPEAADQRVQDMLAGLQLGFSLSGAGALVVGLFLVYNALAVSVAERRHEIGILRSLGATRGQVWGLFVGEALLLGMLGAALGVPAGLGLAHLGLNPIERLLSDLYMAVEARHVDIAPSTVVLAVIAGVATALLAALVPAVRAADEEPASAVRRVSSRFPAGTSSLASGRQRGSRGPGSGGYAVSNLAAGAVGYVWRLRSCPTGLAAHHPAAGGGAGALLQPLARQVLGLEGRLAADNLVRSPGRTGLVITALAAGVTMFVQTAGVIRCNRDPIVEWVDQAFATDLRATSGSPVTGSGLNLLLPEDLGKTFQEAIPEIQTVLPLRCRLVDYGDHMVFLIALDAAGYHDATNERSHPPGWDLFPRLGEPGPGKAVVSKNFAALYHVQEGDSINLGGPRGPVRLEVIGTVLDYDCNQGTVLMDRNQYRKLFGDSLVDEFHVYLQPGADPDAVREKMLRHWEASHALIVTKRAEAIDQITKQINRFAAIAYSQEVVVGLVAALGVVTALLISVLQRRRELGIFRALGATRVQVLRSVLAEAILMGVIGAAIGLLVGVAVEWYNVQVILLEETGFYMPVRIPWLEAGLIALMALVTATLAGLGPALHALRMRIPEAIAYE